jgi:tetratricopeptide (TPR) repeat protein
VRWLTWLQAALIMAAGFFVYDPALHGEFLWDDPQYVTANPLLRDSAGLWKAWFVPGSVMEYYPLQETVLWLQWHFWGPEPFPYHLTNVLLQIASALLLWRLFAQLGLRHGWLGGMVFLVHPANVESVAWISELKNTLSLPPFLVAMTALVRFDETRRGRDYALSLAAFTLAMLVKITMAPFPFVILLYAWWKRGRIDTRDLRVAAPFLAVAVTLAALTVHAYTSFGYLSPDHPTVPPIGGPLARLALAGFTTSFYFLHLFWPWPLLPMYPAWTVNPPPWFAVLPWIAWLALLAWLWNRRASFGRHVLLGLGFFLLMIAPFSGIATQSYMYFTWVMDHFLYIAMIGPIGLLVAGIDQFLQRASAVRRVAVGAAAAIVLVALGVESHDYAAQWRSGDLLWSRTIDGQGAAWLAHYNLGNADWHSGDIDDAIAQYRESIRLHPGFDWSHNNLGSCLVQTPDGLPDAEIEYRAAIRLRPNFAEAHNNLANVLSHTGHLDEALAEYRSALAAQPGLVTARYNMALALLYAGHKPEAAVQFREVIRERPDLTAARIMLQATK